MITAAYTIRRARNDLPDLRVEAEVSRPDPRGFWRWTLLVDGRVWIENADADEARESLLLLSSRGVSRRTIRRCWDALETRVISAPEPRY